jgi:hypothetical protein
MMTIKRIGLDSINAKRFSSQKEAIKEIRINHNSTVTSINAIDNEAHVEFRFTSNYGYLGIITLEGTLIYAGDKLANLTETWEKSGKVSDSLTQEIHSAIMRACLPESVIIAKEVNLPPPIPIPTMPGKKQNKEFKSGPEFA